MTHLPEIRYAGLWRRLFAIIYDSFLLLAILFIVSAIATAMNGGEAITSEHPGYPLYVFCLLLFTWFYFAWFWVHGGQSLGMKTWRLQLVGEAKADAGQGGLSWQGTVIRFCVAMLSWATAGLGFLWALFDAKKRCWHDIASQSVLIDLRKR